MLDRIDVLFLLFVVVMAIFFYGIVLFESILELYLEHKKELKKQEGEDDE